MKNVFLPGVSIAPLDIDDALLEALIRVTDEFAVRVQKLG